MPTSKNTGLAASSKAAVFAVFVSNWHPNWQRFEGEGPGDVAHQFGRPEYVHH
jgi:hypothetical protein